MFNTDNSNFLIKGYRVHWYEIESVLGQGGFGITYSAIDTNLETTVAIKEFFPSDLAIRTNSGSVTITTHSSESEKLYRWGLTSFLREARTLAKFKHKNIVFVYSVFETNNTAYMVMEYLDGQSLEDAFKQKRFSDEASIKKLTFGILDGLQLVHQAGFIHRDIKPANIILRENDEPVLLDFGSARRAFGSKTRALTKLVSSGYSPFEQYSEARDNQGPWTDIYALAATLYHGISGAYPVDSLTRANRILLNGEPDPLISAHDIARSNFSASFLSAIDRGLALQPKDRPQSIEAWKQQLLGISIESTDPDPRNQSNNGDTITIVTGQETIKDQSEITDYIRSRSPVDLLTEFWISAKIFSHELAVSVQISLNQLRVSTKQYYNELALSITRFLTREAGRRKKIWMAAATVVVVVAVITVFRVEIRSKFDRISQLISEYQADRNKRIEIERLLAIADEQLEQDRLSKPDGSQALEIFYEVLTIDPGNSKAIDGIEKVVKRYLTLAEDAQSVNQFDQAEGYLNEVNRIIPDSDIVKSAYADLAGAKRIFEQKQIEETEKLE